MRPTPHHDGYGWRCGPARISKQKAQQICQSRGIAFPTLRDARRTSSPTTVRTMDRAKSLFDKLWDVIVNHMEEEGNDSYLGLSCIKQGIEYELRVEISDR